MTDAGKGDLWTPRLSKSKEIPSEFGPLTRILSRVATFDCGREIRVRRLLRHPPSRHRNPPPYE